jgi:hypothetical protein
MNAVVADSSVKEKSLRASSIRLMLQAVPPALIEYKPKAKEKDKADANEKSKEGSPEEKGKGKAAAQSRPKYESALPSFSSLTSLHPNFSQPA